MKPKACFFLLLLAVSCRAQSPVPQGKDIIFLDSLEAALRISTDRQEGFFEKAGQLDMAIQMRQNTPADEESYRDFLRKDVLDFSVEEKKNLTKELGEAYKRCARLSPYLIPDTLRLIKTKGRHYGPFAWYTREDCIVVPEAALRGFPVQDVILHELFHVLSRKYPGLRKGLYALIGFSRLEDRVVLPEALSARILLNPDGIDRQWAVFLSGKEGKAVPAIPLIFSRYASFNPRRPEFFSHMDFQLFELENDPVAGVWKAVVDGEGASTLGEDFRADYLGQVGDNTTYLIHPDEILADNFIFAVQGPDYWGEFSPEGQSLLRDIVDFLKNWKGD